MDILQLFDTWENTIITDDNSAKKLLTGKNIIIYGAGNNFTSFNLTTLNPGGLRPSVVIDRKFKKGDFKGLPICHPDDFFPTDHELETSIAINCAGQPHFAQEIDDYFKVKGFKYIIRSYEIYDHNLFVHCEDLAHEGLNFYSTRKEAIISAYMRLTDDLSRDIYLTFLKTHLYKKHFPFTHGTLEEQYFASDIEGYIPDYSRWINGGSYIGDTISNLMNRCDFIKKPKIFCFEPNFEPFSMLLKRYSMPSDIVAFPFALWSSNEILSFTSYGMGSSLDKKGIDRVQAIAIDNISIDFKPTFINMDIESAELEALKGAEKTLKKYKPALAICVYHHPNHLWDIPNYIDSLNVGYQFHFRNYTGFAAETVMYAFVP